MSMMTLDGVDEMTSDRCWVGILFMTSAELAESIKRFVPVNHMVQYRIRVFRYMNRLVPPCRSFESTLFRTSVSQS